MSRPKRTISKEEIKKINEVSQKYAGKPLKRLQVIKVIKQEIGWRSCYLIDGLMSNILIRVSRGVYTFPNTPIYMGKIQVIFDNIYKSRKKNRQDVKKLSPIEAAIQLLKDNEFKVTKESFDLDAALKHPNMPVATFIKVTTY